MARGARGDGAPRARRLSACASVVPLAAAAAAAGGEDVGADTIDTDTIDISKI